MKDDEKIVDGGNEAAFPEAFVYDDSMGMAGGFLTAADAGAAPGLTARQYAAIRLRVPDSGSAWLDAMIQRARRDALAGEIAGGMCGIMCASPKKQMAVRGMADDAGNTMHKHIALCALQLADALLAASEGGGDAHGHCESCDRPLGKDDAHTVDSEGICECAKCCVEDAGNAEGGTPDA